MRPRAQRTQDDGAVEHAQAGRGRGEVCRLQPGFGQGVGVIGGVGRGSLVRDRARLAWKRRLQEPLEIPCRGRAQQRDASQDRGGGERGQGARRAAGDGSLWHEHLAAEHGAQHGAEGQQHAGGFQAEVGEVVGEHGDQAGGQRGLHPIAAGVGLEVAEAQRQAGHDEKRARDAGLDQKSKGLILDELEPVGRRQGLVDRVHAAECPQPDARRVRADQPESIQPHANLSQVIAAGRHQRAGELLGSEAERDADDHHQADEHGGEAPAVKGLAIVRSGRKQEPRERPRPQGQHRAARQRRERAGGKHRRGDLPDPLSVAGGAGEGEGQGGEGGEFEKLGGVIGVDERPHGQTPAGGNQPVDLVFGYRAMAEAHHQRRQSPGRDQSGRDEAHAASGREHQRGQAHGQRRGGLGQPEIGFGRIEA